MNYYVYNIEDTNARIFKKKHYQFDYIEPDSFEKMQNSNDFSVIGCIKLKEIEKEDATDTVVISSGLTDHYFKLMPPDKTKHLSKRQQIGYVMVSKDTYAAVYKHSILKPLLLSIAFLAGFCILIFIKAGESPAFINESNLSNFCIASPIKYCLKHLLSILYFVTHFHN